MTTFQLDPGLFDRKQMKLTSAQENTLSNVAVLQFDAAGNFVKYLYCGGVVNNNKLSLNLTSGSAQTVAFVANVADAAPFKTFTGSLTTFRALTKTVANEAALTAGNVLVMYGEYRGNMIGGKTPAAVVMKRVVAKIELSYWVDIPDAADKHESFTLKKIRLRNVPQVISYADPAAIYPATTAAFGDYPAVVVSTQPTPTAKGSQVWVVAENKRGMGTADIASQKTAAALTSGGDKATYLEMVGDYTKEGKTLELTYRLYLGADPVKDYNLKRNAIYRIETVIKGANVVDLRISATGGSTVGIDDVPVDDETGNVSLGGNQVANCYLVHPNADADLMIPVRRANEIYQNQICDRYGVLGAAGYRQKDSIPAVAVDGRTWVAEVLWQDNSAEMVNITNGTITTRTDQIRIRPTGVPGNCVIGLRSSDSRNVLWSWHLWITDCEPVTDYAGDLEVGETHQYTGWMATNAKYIMDRNLGAQEGQFGVDSWGLLYQWGRKDPFVGAAGVGVATRTWYVPTGSGGFRAATEMDVVKTAAGAGDNNIYGGVMNATTFYVNGTAGDWTTRNDLLWQDGVKTLFDPCPSGWRVPQSAVWQSVAAANAVWETTHANGVRLRNIVLGGPAWYPAQGYRAGITGEVTAGSSVTGNWSSTINGVSATAWRTLSTFEAPGPQGRANGYPVRCVKE